MVPRACWQPVVAGIIFGIILFFAEPATADTIYVSPTGNGSNPKDGSETNAASTIDAAITVSAPGDTIYLFPGYYTFNTTIQAADTDPLFFVGQDSASVTIHTKNDNPFYLVNVDTAYYYFGRMTLRSNYSIISVTGDSPELVIDDCTLSGTTGSGFYSTAAGSLTMRGCNVTGCGDGDFSDGGLYYFKLFAVDISNTRFTNCTPYGIYHSGGDTALIADCAFDSIAKYGVYDITTKPVTITRCMFSAVRDTAVYFSSGNAQSLVQNCLFVDNEGAAIHSRHSCQIYNNTIRNNTDGIFLDINPAYTVTIKNNIISNNRRSGLYIYDNSSNLSASYNLFYNDMNVYDDDGADTVNSPLEMDDIAGLSSNYAAEPWFTNATGDTTGDYTLQGFSPGVDYGDPAFAFTDEPGPNGNRINLGMYGNTGQARTSDYFGANQPPYAVFSGTPVPYNAGDGVMAAIQVSDPDGDNTVRVRLEYSRDGSFTRPSPCTIVPGSVSADTGTPAIDNAARHQLGAVAGWIETSGGTNTVNFSWDMDADVSAPLDGYFYLRAIAFDGTDSAVLPPVSASFTDGVLTVDDDPGKEYSTIAAALAQSQTGDTIYIYNGNYNESFDIGPADPDVLFFVGEDSSATVVQHTNTVFAILNVDTAAYHFRNMKIAGSGSNYAMNIGGDSPTITVEHCIITAPGNHGLYNYSAGTITIRHTTFTECGNGGFDAGASVSGHTYAEIDACTFVNCNPYGFYTSGGDSTVILNSTFDSCDTYGAYLINSSNPFYISGCGFYRNGSAGAYVTSGNAGSQIRNSLFINNPAAGVDIRTHLQLCNNTFVNNQDGAYLDIYDGINTLIRNNIFADNTRSGIYILDNSSGHSFSDNLFYNPMNVFDDDDKDTANTSREIEQIDNSSTNYAARPYFIRSTGDSTGDYRVNGFSPAVDLGNTAFEYALEPAPNGSRINLGRYGNTEEAATSNYFSANNPPVARFAARPQGYSDGSRVRVTIGVSDPDYDDAVRLRVEYDTTGAFYGPQPCTLLSFTVSATQGQPTVDNNSYYQLGQSGGWIETGSGTNTITFDWDIGTDLPGLANNSLYLRVTACDGNDSSVIPDRSDRFTDGTLTVDDDGGKDYTTIGDAITAAADGDTIYIYAGTYNENLSCDKELALIGEDSGTVSIISPSHSNHVIYLNGDTGYYHFENLTLQGGNFGLAVAPSPNTVPCTITIRGCRFIGDTTGVYFFVAGSYYGQFLVENCVAQSNRDDGFSFYHGNVTIRNSYAYDNAGGGFNVAGADTIFIDHCISAGNGGAGIFLQLFDAGDIRNTLVVDNGGHGILFGTSSDSVLIENSTIHNNGISGIKSSGDSDSPVIRNCIISTNASYGIEDSDFPSKTMNPALYYNLFFFNRLHEFVTDDDTITYNTTFDINSRGAAGVAEGNIVDNIGSLFDTPYVNDTGDSTGDYHLSYGSPFIDTGMPGSDYSNEPQPNGNRVNIGMYANSVEATISSPPAGGNNAPWVTFDTQPAQVADAGGSVAIGLFIHDADNDTVELKLEYSLTGSWGGEEADPTLYNGIDSGYGWAQVNNGLFSQVYNINTGSGTNPVTVYWLSASDSASLEDTTVWLRITAADGAGTTVITSDTVSVDNRPPRELGDLVDSGAGPFSVTLGYGSAAYDPNFYRYRVYYNDSTSVTENDTECTGAESALTAMAYNSEASLTIADLKGGETYSFIIIAYDTMLNRTSSAKVIMVPSANSPPYAVTGSDTGGAETLVILLNGSSSYDSDAGTTLSYLWTVDNDSISIANETDSVTTASFTGAGYFTLTLNVNDGVDTGTADTFAVNIYSNSLAGDFTAVAGSGGKVDIEDLKLLSNEAGVNWEAAPTITPATDLDGDGILEFDDVSAFGGQYGTTE